MNFNNLSLYKPKMEYRRFGKTDKKISVITLGGMRYKHGWSEPRDVIPDDTLEECKNTVETAFSMGINHIETAYGYKKSEHAYGTVLNDVLKIKRESYYLMTKGAPSTADETRVMVEKQLKALKTDYFDFYGWHGMNNLELYHTACKKGGAVEELLKLKAEGVIKHVGFSTHAPLDVIIKAIETNLFDFVNLHYYYFFQRNKAAIDLAASKDMGVFIISPNDKGGQLSTPPQKLRDLTSPLTPVQWNARFCLSNPAVHTLSFGLPATCSFDQIEGIFPVSTPLSPDDEAIKQRMDDQKKLDKYSYYDGYDMVNDPSKINIPEMLRLRMMYKCYDMKNFGIYRYNMFRENDSWVPGALPTEEKLALVDVSKCPKEVPLIELLRETHQAFYKPQEKSNTSLISKVKGVIKKYSLRREVLTDK